MNVLFWNTCKNTEIDSYIYDFVEEVPCDIIILAEYPNNVDRLCVQLSFLQKDFYPWITAACSKLSILSASSYKAVLLRDDYRYCIYSVKSVWNDFLATALHLPSKLYSDSFDMEAYARRIKNDIEKEEEHLGHRRTFIAGDFNANPFESICINADCFHALPNGMEAQQGARTVNGFSYTTFYNPMWNLFGDFEGVCGSYFYDKNHIHTYQWNIYDQVILRPELINLFVNNNLKIINTIKGKSLLSRNGQPDRKISDHLPVYFEIKEEL